MNAIHRKHIFLIGPMGAGKTTVGRKLAVLLGRNFIDMDQELVERTGVTIAHIFEVEGESGFRDRETRLLEEICTAESRVVSTGGGIVLRARNRELMRSTGRIVYLDIPSEVLWERLRNCRNRPLLQGDDPKARMEEIRAQREPLYQDAADYRIPIAAQSAMQMAHRIQQSLCHETVAES